MKRRSFLQAFTALLLPWQISEKEKLLPTCAARVELVSYPPVSSASFADQLDPMFARITKEQFEKAKTTFESFYYVK